MGPHPWSVPALIPSSQPHVHKQNSSCKNIVPYISGGWCKPCRKAFSAKGDYKQVCKDAECREIVGRKNQHTGHAKWCKPCRIASAQANYLQKANREGEIPTLTRLRKTANTLSYK